MHKIRLMLKFINFQQIFMQDILVCKNFVSAVINSMNY